MKGNIFQNKKFLIALIVVIIALVVAIVAFIVLGLNKNNGKNTETSTIQFPENTSNNTKNNTANRTTNNTNNNTANNASENKTPSGSSNEFYEEVAEKFAVGFMNKDDMKDFLEDYVDLKAYVAYESVNQDDELFYDEYESISDDDERIDKLKDDILKFPENYRYMIDLVDKMQQMTDEVSDTDESVNENELQNISEEDKKFKLVEVSKPIKINADLEMNSVVATYSWIGQEQDITFIFISDVLMYICDEEGNSITIDIDEEMPDGSNSLDE